MVIVSILFVDLRSEEKLIMPQMHFLPSQKRIKNKKRKEEQDLHLILVLIIISSHTNSSPKETFYEAIFSTVLKAIK